MLVYTAPSLIGAGALVKTKAHTHRHRPLFAFRLPPDTLPGSAGHTLFSANEGVA